MTFQVPPFMSDEVSTLQDLQFVFCLMTFIHVICLYYEFWVERVRLYYSSETTLLRFISKEEDTQLALVDLIKLKCPRLAGFSESLFFHPTPYLFSGHLQTIWASVYSKYLQPKVYYEREHIRLPDGGSIALDWYPGHTAQPFDNTPVVLIVHGLTGGSHESYIQDTVFALTHPEREFEGDDYMNKRPPFRCVAFNFRGCANTRITTPRLYCAAYTEDLRHAVAHIRSRLPPDTQMMAVGFSMGANVLVKVVITSFDPFI